MIMQRSRCRQPLFVQYTAFKADPAWRRLPYAAREDGRESFARAIEECRAGDQNLPVQHGRA